MRKELVMNNLWRQNVTEKLWDGIRLTTWGVLAVDVALLCMFSLWFIAMSLWHLRGWCARVLFNSDW
jgi:hypothetical protein